ncbi:PRADC1-like protein isoform X2 [Maniola hyperantus]|uniref:PRADC1-like protein isoform X2 n=1 Tax=Aphantopus hyperantus TaxID=2795564 RepID=UPI00156A45BA|nr:PRADC1-like protein [Maniola hyperantus]
MFSNVILHYLLQNISLFLLICTTSVSPGANDLHFHDGSSTADIIAGDVFFEIIDPPELRYSYRIRPAKDFGASFNGSISFEKARLVPTIPFHSCSEIKNQDDIFGNIALSERGECSFVYKTMNAQLAGAQAVIITETVDKWDDALDHLIEMVDDKMEVDVNIPAAFLLGRSGATILRTLKRLHRKYAIINLPINMTHVPISRMNQPPWISW